MSTGAGDFSPAAGNRSFDTGGRWNGSGPVIDSVPPQAVLLPDTGEGGGEGRQVVGAQSRRYRFLPFSQRTIHQTRPKCSAPVPSAHHGGESDGANFTTASMTRQ